MLSKHLNSVITIPPTHPNNNNNKINNVRTHQKSSSCEFPHRRWLRALHAHESHASKDALKTVCVRTASSLKDVYNANADEGLWPNDGNQTRRNWKSKTKQTSIKQKITDAEFPQHFLWRRERSSELWKYLFRLKRESPSKTKGVLTRNATHPINRNFALLDAPQSRLIHSPLSPLRERPA